MTDKEIITALDEIKAITVITGGRNEILTLVYKIQHEMQDRVANKNFGKKK